MHTDSGRLGLVVPYQVNIGVGDRPALASYKAGPGTQPGLLQSPVAVAVTNPGVVLMLEAGGNQLAAFDLNCDPLKYFPAGDGYRLPLVAAGTYLDLAVDGSGHIYLLYYTGDGTAPSDYHIDVYTAAGAPLVTQSPASTWRGWPSTTGAASTASTSPRSAQGSSYPTWTPRSAPSSPPSAASIL